MNHNTDPAVAVEGRSSYRVSADTAPDMSFLRGLSPRTVSGSSAGTAETKHSSEPRGSTQGVTNGQHRRCTKARGTRPDTTSVVPRHESDARGSNQPHGKFYTGLIHIYTRISMGEQSAVSAAFGSESSGSVLSAASGRELESMRQTTQAETEGSV